MVFQLNVMCRVVVSCLAKTVLVRVNSMVCCRLPHDDEHCPLGICPAVDITSAMYVSNFGKAITRARHQQRSSKKALPSASPATYTVCTCSVIVLHHYPDLSEMI